jgi:putative ABC transport system permease protein
MNVLWSDLRIAVRGLLKARAFSAAAIAALAIGIGPNTAIFSVVYATLLAPLPFPNPDELVMVWSKTPSGGRSAVSSGDYLAWKESATSFQYLEPFSPRAFNLATPDEPLRVRARRVTPDGHRMLGEGVALGRDFQPGDDQPGKNQIVLFSNRLWLQRYNSDPGIIGRDIRMDGRPHTVVGVLPPGPSDRLPADLWMPLTFAPAEVNYRSHAADHGAPEAGRHHRAGPASDDEHRRRARASRTEVEHGMECLGRTAPEQFLERRPADDVMAAAGGGGICGGDRVCERGEPAAGARHVARA